MNQENSTTSLVYAYVRQCIEQQGYSPSLREIAENCYIGVGTVRYNLDKLEARGLIARVPRIARGLTLVKREDR